MAIGIAEIGVGKDADVAGAIDAAGFDQRVLRLAAMGAGVHPQRAADGAGNAAIKGKTVDPGFGGGARRFHVGNGGADAQPATVFDDGLAKALRRKPNDYAFDAAVAHDEIGAEPNDGHRNFAGRLREEVGKVGFVGRHEENLRRPADAKPGQRRERLIRGNASAQLRHGRGDVGGNVRKGHAAPRSLVEAMRDLRRLASPRACSSSQKQVRMETSLARSLDL